MLRAEFRQNAGRGGSAVQSQCNRRRTPRERQSRLNIEKNWKKLERLGKPIPVVIQGDARNLSKYIVISDAIRWARAYNEVNNPDPSNEVIGSIFFPPYAEGSAHTGGDDPHPEHMTGGRFVGVGLNGAISSPAYAESVHDGNGIDASKLTGNPPGAHPQAFADGYGKTAGQIGALREGSFESVVGAVTSPPYEASVNTQDKGGIDWAKAGRPDRLVQSDDRHGVQGDMPMAYGVSDGQIGAE